MEMHGTWRPRAFAALSIVALAASGCAGAQPSPSPAMTAGATIIQVNLQEWAVVPASTTTAAGDVTFRVTNTGPEDVHEFVILKTDLDPGALPVDANGAVTETGAGIVVIDEIEDIPVGQTRELKVTLAAGKYVLLCNIYDDGEKEAHYAMGMRVAFDVSG
jgi:uncharacterized cupredoxin-like copper-binding protein